MKIIRTSLLSILILVTISCGGSSGSLTTAHALGSWLGRFLQAGGVNCVDSFIGACSGCELGDIKVDISRVDGQYTLEVEHCNDNAEQRALCTTCLYTGSETNHHEIVATSDNQDCAKEARFTLISENSADLFEDGREPTGNKCTIDVSSSLTKSTI